MTMRLTAAALSATVLAAALPAWAHHAFDAEFDPAAPITLTGTLTQVEWVNPHVWLHMTVETPGKGPQDWMVEAYTPNALLRAGLDRKTLTRGTEVTIRALRPKDRRCLESPVTHNSTCKANGRALGFAKGPMMFIGSIGDGAPYDPAESRAEYDCARAAPFKAEECRAAAAPKEGQ